MSQSILLIGPPTLCFSMEVISSMGQKNPLKYDNYA